MSWNPKHILLTGASSGIGAELARALATPGRHICLSGRNRTRITKVAHACAESGAQTEIGMFDVRDPDATSSWAQRCFDHKPVDLIIANAGISGVSDGVNDDPIAVIDTNFKGVVNVVSAAMPLLMSTEQAARTILMGLARNKGLIAFPWQTYLFVRLLTSLPAI